jgi:hypothetical protein
MKSLDGEYISKNGNYLAQGLFQLDTDSTYAQK